LTAPQPIERLALLRILVPLALLGFLATRLVHAGEWLTAAGFHVPDVGADDYRQPLYIPPLPPWGAWTIAATTALAALACAAGAWTRVSAAVLGSCIALLALADRLEAFTVTKLGAPLALALAIAPSGARYGVDAWRAARRAGWQPPTHVRAGAVRFFQALTLVVYSGSGVCKLRGDWLRHPAVLWTHLHDSYQTWVTYAIARALPARGWTVAQGLVLTFEVLAPIWFSWSRSRPYALAFGLGMHVFIGLCFGPVVWFAVLMAILLVGGFAPEPWLLRAFATLRRLGTRTDTSR
jgi:hypothetical protein